MVFGVFDMRCDDNNKTIDNHWKTLATSTCERSGEECETEGKLHWIRPKRPHSTISISQNVIR